MSKILSVKGQDVQQCEICNLRCFITARNEVAKVMFLHVSVILFMGVVVSQHALQVVSQHALKQGVPAPGGICSRGCLLPGGVETPPPEAEGYCCGRYASYWNAFLF